MKFSKREIGELVIAWILISVAFAILLSGGLSENLIKDFPMSLALSSLTVGIAFLLHELMHKFLAQKYNLWAEFRASYGMLLLAIGFSFFGFIIAAPGGVLLKGKLTKEKHGKIALAGPITNLVIALILLPLLFFPIQGFFGQLINYGFIINTILALFNLIPAIPFDGYDIYQWNKKIFYITVSIALILFLIVLFF